MAEDAHLRAVRPSGLSTGWVSRDGSRSAQRRRPLTMCRATDVQVKTSALSVAQKFHFAAVGQKRIQLDCRPARLDKPEDRGDLASGERSMRERFSWLHAASSLVTPCVCGEACLASTAGQMRSQVTAAPGGLQ
jgi:hypothetical protein